MGEHEEFQCIDYDGYYKPIIGCDSSKNASIQRYIRQVKPDGTWEDRLVTEREYERMVHKEIVSAMNYSRCVEVKRRKKWQILAYILVFIAFFCILSHATYSTRPQKEQKFIVRYGAAQYDFGESFLTEDGNIWEVKDAPEFAAGDKVRIVFDSQETIEATDDVIVDITAR